MIDFVVCICIKLCSGDCLERSLVEGKILKEKVIFQFDLVNKIN